MSVRQSLLAILDQGPCYGYQLRAEFDRRTGSTWPLNVGQIYNTLDRLERDGLVAKGEVDEHGHVYWHDHRCRVGRRCATGSRSPVARARTPRGTSSRSSSPSPRRSPASTRRMLIRQQRSASLVQLRALQQTAYPGPADGPEGLAWALVVDSMIAQAEAELRWLDRAEERLARHPEHALALELATERPKRGRPARESSAA